MAEDIRRFDGLTPHLFVALSKMLRVKPCRERAQKVKRTVFREALTTCWKQLSESQQHVLIQRMRFFLFQRLNETAKNLPLDELQHQMYGRYGCDTIFQDDLQYEYEDWQKANIDRFTSPDRCVRAILLREPQIEEISFILGTLNVGNFLNTALVSYLTKGCHKIKVAHDMTGKFLTVQFLPDQAKLNIQE